MHPRLRPWRDELTPLEQDEASTAEHSRLVSADSLGARLDPTPPRSVGRRALLLFFTTLETAKSRYSEVNPFKENPNHAQSHDWQRRRAWKARDDEGGREGQPG